MKRIPCLACAAIFTLATACQKRAFNSDRGEAGVLSSEKLTHPCIESAFEALKIDSASQTKPELIRDILQNDMFLDDFPPVASAFDGEWNKPLSLKPMLSTIKRSLAEKHPALVEFLCVAQKEKLLPAIDADGQKMIQRTIHHTFVLNEIVKRMSADVPFMSQIIAHLRAKRPQFGIRPDLVKEAQDVNRITGEWFTPAKTVTMDLGIDIVMNGRTHGGAGAPVGEDLKNDPSGLILNILEASTTDLLHGFKPNTLVGIALAVNPVQVYRIKPENLNIQWKMTQEWASLYETWNLAFLTGNLGNLNLLYPKLLAPEVLDAPADDYLIQRTEALWLSINFILFAQAGYTAHRVENGVVRDIPIKGRNVMMPNSQRLARAWGDVNLKYARAFVKSVNHRELNDVTDLISIPASRLFDEAISSVKKGIDSFGRK